MTEVEIIGYQFSTRILHQLLSVLLSFCLNLDVLLSDAALDG